MLSKNIIIILLVVMTSVISAQTVEVRKNANNEPRVELVNPGSNTFIGDEAGRVNTGINNTFNGHQTGYSNIGGSQISFFGQNSGYSNTTGNFNSFFGWRSGFANTTGNSNSFFGSDAGYANINGMNNSFFGVISGKSNTTGSENSFFGSSSGFDNTTGSFNSFYGLNAGANNTTADSNSFYGHAAGFSNTTGMNNSFFGKGAGYKNTTGNFNSFFGQGTGYSNTVGVGNSFFGWQSGFKTTIGIGNSFYGSHAGFNHISGAGNSFYGESSGGSTTSGSSNSFFGDDSGMGNITGEKNTTLGTYADVLQSNLSNAAAIGYNAKVAASNSLVLGGTGVDAVKVGIGTATPNASAALDVSSTTKGFLPPRMTVAERDLIVGPVAGLIIWCSNCGMYGEVQVFNGIFWLNIAKEPLVIGQSYQGGIIFYLLQAGDPGYSNVQHGLIYYSGGFVGEWGCYGTGIPGADGIALGTGNQNTLDIVNGCAQTPIVAKSCNDFVAYGYSDWYLASKDELNKLYLYLTANGGGGNTFWSSSEDGNNNAWGQNLSTGIQSSMAKNISNYAFPIRSF